MAETIARVERRRITDGNATEASWEARHAPILAELAAVPRARPSLFASFFQGGFECSTHRRATDRGRIDVIAATGHDRHAAADYRRLRDHGIRTVRDGLRWHLIGHDAGRFDWSSLDPMLAAARETATEVLWDLFHYGWPDRIDIWHDDFATEFAAFAAAAADRIRAATPGTRFYAPINEISFFAWGGGDVACINPFQRDRGDALKRQLGRAAAAAMAAIRAADPGARFIHADPLIHITAEPGADPRRRADAEHHRLFQYAAWDMIAGRRWPELGGCADHLDIVGVNYYAQNQWLHHGDTIEVGDPLYKPFRYLLIEAYARYRRPIFIAETGIEDEERPAWFRYICGEVRAAMRAGVPIEGICLYPVLDHPGWDDGRDCHNGLLEHLGDTSPRPIYRPLADELARQQQLFAAEFGIAG